MQANSRKPERWKSANDARMSTLVESAKGKSDPEPVYRRQQSFPANSTELQNEDSPILDFPAWLEDQLKFSKTLSSPLMEKKKGIMGGFKAFRAISRMGTKRMSCDFYMHVHGIEGLPPGLNGSSVTVRWERKETMTLTVPSHIVKGVAEIEQTLGLKCTLYSSGSSSTHRFLPKESKITVTLKESSAVIGNYEVDLAKILPADIHEENTPCTTSFSLKGRGAGGHLVVTFGYELKASKGHSLEARVENRTWKSYSTPVSARTSAINSPTGSSPDRRFSNQPPPGAFEFKGVHVREDSFDESERDFEAEDFELHSKDKGRNLHEHSRADGRSDWEIQEVNEISHLQNLEVVKEEDEEMEEEEEKAEEKSAVEIVKHEDVKELKEDEADKAPKHAVSSPSKENAVQEKSKTAQTIIVETKEISSDVGAEIDHSQRNVIHVIELDGSDNDNDVISDRDEKVKSEIDSSKYQTPDVEKFKLVQLKDLDDSVDNKNVEELVAVDRDEQVANLKNSEDSTSRVGPISSIPEPSKDVEKSKILDDGNELKNSELNDANRLGKVSPPNKTASSSEPNVAVEKKEQEQKKENEQESVQEQEENTQQEAKLSVLEKVNLLEKGLPLPNPPEISQAQSSPPVTQSTVTKSSTEVAPPSPSVLSPALSSSPPKSIVTHSSPPSQSNASFSSPSSSSPTKPSEKIPSLPIGAIGLYSFKKDIGPKPIPIPVPISQKEVLKTVDKDELPISKSEFDEKLNLYSNKKDEIKQIEGVDDKKVQNHKESSEEKYTSSKPEPKQDVQPTPEPSGNVPITESPDASLQYDLDFDLETDMIADEFLELLGEMMDKEREGYNDDTNSSDPAIPTTGNKDDDVNTPSSVNSSVEFGTSPVFGLLSHADVSQELFLDSPSSPTIPSAYTSYQIKEEDSPKGERIEIVDVDLGESDDSEDEEKDEEDENAIKATEKLDRDQGERTDDEEDEEEDEDDEDEDESDEEGEEEESDEEEEEEEDEEDDEDEEDAEAEEMFELTQMILDAEAEHKRAMERAARSKLREKELEEEEKAEQTWIKEKSNLDSSQSSLDTVKSSKDISQSNNQGVLHPLSGGRFPQDLTIPPLSTLSSPVTSSSPSVSSALAIPPSFGEGMGSAIPLKDGGMLLAMTPKHFVSQQGNLVMQVSKPVVVPEGLGTSAVEIMQHMASIGGDDLAEQAKLLMPLDEISGKSIEQMYAEGLIALEGAERSQKMLPGGKSNKRLAIRDSSHDSSMDSAITTFNPGEISTGESRVVSYGGKNFESRESRALARALNRGVDNQQLAPGQYPDDFVALEEVAPLAVDMIETLAIEGLKIQSGVDDDESPGLLPALPLNSRRKQKSSHLGSGASIHLLDGGQKNMLTLDEESVKEESDEESAEPVDFGFESMAEDGFMGMAISLDEWQRLDAGMFDEQEMENDTLSLLAEHESLHQEIVPINQRGNKWDEEEVEEIHGSNKSLALRKKRESLVAGRKTKDSESENGGLMGNTVTLAMLVQLRDPLRNYEPVGAPMMALVQAERIIVPPPAKITRRIAMHGDWNEEQEKKEKEREQKMRGVSKFKITGVHMMGFNEERETWSNKKQNQAGSRWMAANGMSKGKKGSAKKKPFMPEEVKVKPGETLWSISQKMHGSGTKWKEVVRLNPHIRNPDIILPNQKVKLR